MNQVSFDTEPLILVDENDRPIGHELKSSAHLGKGILHRAFSVFLLDSDGKLILQKRSEKKPLWPMVWSNTVCSHPRKGEDLNDAVNRRIEEELGVRAEFYHAFHFIYHATYSDESGEKGSEHEFCHVFYGKTNEALTTHPDEVAEVAHLSLEEVDERVSSNPDSFSPWFVLEWERILPHLKKLRQAQS